LFHVSCQVEIKDLRRNFLFLQGVCSPYFARLADRLRADGHRIFRVNFNAGDLTSWAPRSSWQFRGKPEILRDFLDEKYRRFGITDQILFGDRRPVHRPAVDHGEACGVRTHVYEEGYFRPHWVTLEREGVNGHSLLPRDPDWFREVGGRLHEPPPAMAFHTPFRVRTQHDVAYHLAGAGNALLFPHYRGHAPAPAPVEYAGYLWRLSRVRFWHSRRDAAEVVRLAGGNLPFYLLPLQLNSDAQIRDHSRFKNMGEVMEHVLESFARHAPSGSRLVIKNHPLDAGLVNHRQALATLLRRFGLDGRVDYLESGNLDALLERARGCVTVNSTVGIVSLAHGCPTTTLSDPIYNLPGLTFQGHLDDFWSQGERPDAEMFKRFRRVVMHTTQVNGGFYCRQGIALAVENSLPFLTCERSPLEALL